MKATPVPYSSEEGITYFLLPHDLTAESKRTSEFHPAFSKHVFHIAAQRADGIIDIGANYGTFSLPLAKNLSPTPRIWAIEPNPKLAECIRLAVNKNDIDRQRFTIHECALGYEPGSAIFKIDPFTSESSTLGEPTEVTNRKGNLTIRYPVPVEILDRIIGVDEYSQIGSMLMKIDTEGYDFHVLSGAKLLLKSVQSLCLMIEVSYRALDEATKIYSDLLNILETEFTAYALSGKEQNVCPVPPGALVKSMYEFLDRNGDWSNFVFTRDFSFDLDQLAITDFASGK